MSGQHLRRCDSAPFSSRSHSLLSVLWTALQCINGLKKLANHPALVYDECRDQEAPGEVKSAFSLFPENYVPIANMSDVSQSSKLAVLAHLLAAIKQAGQKVVVVSNYRQT